MISTSLSSKGQLVIPLAIRQRLGLSAGDRLLCDVDGDRLILTPDDKAAASMRMGEDGLPILSAPTGAPQMTPELVRDLLAED